MSESGLKYFELYLQIATAIISVLFLFKRKSRFSILLSILLVLSAFVEVLGEYGTLNKIPVFKLYYCYSLVQFSLIFYMYYCLIEDKRRLIFGMSVLFSLFWVGVFFKPKMFPYLIIIGSIITSLSVFLYLRGILLSDKILNYRRILSFWVSVGFLVFYLPSIPFFSMLNFMKTRGLFFVISVLVVLMDLIIILGFLCSKEEEY